VTAPKDLLPGASGDWQVKVKASKQGTYEMYVAFYVDGKKVIFQVEGGTGTIEQFETMVTVSEPPFLERYGLYLIAVVAVAVVAVVLMICRRGRAAAPPSTIFFRRSSNSGTACIIKRHETSHPCPTAGKFCINCGAAMPETVRFCSKCGAQQP
jgi:predicted nucleic acid-binding Zn ribbon protein